MPTDDTPPDLAEIARQACRDRGLDEREAPVVQQMMGRPESCWAPCCNDNCDPCADDFAAAARRGQQLVEASRLTGRED